MGHITRMFLSPSCTRTLYGINKEQQSLGVGWGADGKLQVNLAPDCSVPTGLFASITFPFTEGFISAKKVVTSLDLKLCPKPKMFVFDDKRNARSMYSYLFPSKSSLQLSPVLMQRKRLAPKVRVNVRVQRHQVVQPFRDYTTSESGNKIKCLCELSYRIPCLLKTSMLEGSVLAKSFR